MKKKLLNVNIYEEDGRMKSTVAIQNQRLKYNELNAAAMVLGAFMTACSQLSVDPIKLMDQAKELHLKNEKEKENE